RYIDAINAARERSVEMRKARFAKSARVGDKAPGFYLKDSLNQNYSIERFRGKWVLLSFLESENFQNDHFTSLVNTYTANKDRFELVNIYTDYDKLYWGKIIGKLPPSGVHLFCKGNWTNLLTNLYGLERFPYYVLVDPEGIIRYSRPGIFSDAFSLLNINK
ncbi:MAG TPA: thioredoxin-like domain-containing protein, partial [Bacteroidales bacterium]|nr:thioredoxin-like domain-containing protein [Bacteroidales bacterium]